MPDCLLYTASFSSLSASATDKKEHTEEFSMSCIPKVALLRTRLAPKLPGRIYLQLLDLSRRKRPSSPLHTSCKRKLMQGDPASAMVDVSSAAILGYLAPVCLAFFVFIAWICVEVRRRERTRNLHSNDAETAPLGSSRAVISSHDVERCFPQMRFSDWLSARTRCMPAKETTEARVSSVAADTTSVFVLEIAPVNDSPRAEDMSTDAPRPVSGGGETTPTGFDIMQASPGTGESFDMADSSRECVICMEEFHGPDYIRPLTCGHIFHVSCLDPWLTRRHACCPLCKTDYCNARAPRIGWLRGGSGPTVPQAVLIRTDIVPRF
ncbi:hypothetical protein BO82DRAFT_366770 [Aspergillus uvarum CBS 121591]|uniref:RING-type domain-containing protein n=1 Tax=Aspergillus uvarum CBS 121591 TaxID=1448315 RepID=A0A319CL24_9EURO|nr:hypothetical protein BO82DRAFT_366770 [Aspergillus uvarum CBS 121591]PYH79393.1 hypothetical protein BO82DRAFT_366770 [Aspergillus uvarum CBS 121591]